MIHETLEQARPHLEAFRKKAEVDRKKNAHRRINSFEELAALPEGACLEILNENPKNPYQEVIWSNGRLYIAETFDLAGLRLHWTESNIKIRLIGGGYLYRKESTE